MDDTPQTPAAPTTSTTSTTVTTPTTPTTTPATPGPLSSFARFILCGGGIGLLSSGAVALLAGSMPWALANAIITIASTLLCTELHARFTFATPHRPGLREHWQSAGSAAAAYAATTAATLTLHLLHPSPTALTEQITYLTASALAGTGRFLILRLVVFTADRDRNPAPAPRLRTPNKATPLPALALTLR